MRITLRKFRPSVHGIGAWPFAGSVLLCAVTSWTTDFNFISNVWPALLLALALPMINVFNYLSLKYFYLTRRIKSASRRKQLTDLIRFWVLILSDYTLIYAEFEGDHEDLAYVAEYFAENVPGFVVRISMTNPGANRSELRLFSDKKISHEIALTKDVEVVGGTEVGSVLRKRTTEFKELREQIEKDETMN